MKLFVIVLSWYFLLVGFSISFFYGNGWPAANNPIVYLGIVPYLGFGALVWSMFFGVGVAILLVSLILALLWLRSGNLLYVFFQPLLGIVGGMVFRHTST